MAENLSWSADNHLALQNPKTKPMPGCILRHFNLLHVCITYFSKNHSILGLPQEFLSNFPTKLVDSPLVFHPRATCRAHNIPFNITAKQNVS